MKDYTRKTIYMGIDVHKKTYAVTTICDKEVVKKDTLPAYPEYLVKYIKKYFAGADVNTVYEAGFSGFYLHRILLANKINNIIVHPASIETAAKNRVKTDKKDSLKLAKQLSDGDLHGINVPSIKRECYRSITRIRDSIVENRKRTGNQIKGLLYMHGLIDPMDTRKASKTWIKSLESLEMPEDIRYCINLYAQMWLGFDDKLKTILKRLHEQSEQDKVLDIIYRAVPGIGALSSRILANELEDMKHFRNEKALFSYTGLTPSEHSSGEHKRLGRISRQGKPVLRKILVQVAWRAIKYDTRLAEVFKRISERAGKKRAIIGVARRLIGIVRSNFMSGELYMCANAPDRNEHLPSTVEAC